MQANPSVMYHNVCIDCHIFILCSLSVMMSSLPTDEEVKMFKILIALRIKYWTLKSGCGVVTSFDTGQVIEWNIIHSMTC